MLAKHQKMIHFSAITTRVFPFVVLNKMVLVLEIADRPSWPVQNAPAYVLQSSSSSINRVTAFLTQPKLDAVGAA